LYEQHGDVDRARFIRLQLQLARLPDDVDSPEWLPMIEESQRLLQSHYMRWTTPYADLHFEYGQYDRGFIELVAIEGARLVDDDYTGKLFDRLPIRHVDVTSRANCALRDVMDVTRRRNLVSLGLDNLGLTDHDVPDLVPISSGASPALPLLRWLSLTRNELTIQGVRRLAEIATAQMPALYFVDFAGNQYDPMDEIDFDQHVALTWRRGDEEASIFLVAPWVRPRIVDGRVEPLDRLAFGRPLTPPPSVDAISGRASTA
jgi:hypothetical protein